MISTISNEQALEKIEYLISNMSAQNSCSDDLVAAVSLLAQYDQDLVINPRDLLKLLYYSPLKSAVLANLIELNEFEYLRHRFSGGGASEKNRFKRLLQQYDEQQTKDLPLSDFLSKTINRKYRKYVDKYNYSTIKNRIKNSDYAQFVTELPQWKAFLEAEDIHFTEQFRNKLVYSVIYRIRKDTAIFTLENLPVTFEDFRYYYSSSSRHSFGKSEIWKQYYSIVIPVLPSNYLPDIGQYAALYALLNFFYDYWTNCQYAWQLEQSHHFFLNQTEFRLPSWQSERSDYSNYTSKEFFLSDWNKFSNEQQQYMLTNPRLSQWYFKNVKREE